MVTGCESTCQAASTIVLWCCGAREGSACTCWRGGPVGQRGGSYLLLVLSAAEGGTDMK